MKSAGEIFDDSSYPVTARFHSPDPLIQDITSCQSFNSYAYCMNNPLKYNDPSGYKFLDFILKLFKRRNKEERGDTNANNNEVTINDGGNGTPNGHAYAKYVMRPGEVTVVAEANKTPNPLPTFNYRNREESGDENPSGGGLDNPEYTTHNLFVTPTTMPGLTIETCITVGKGPVHMMSINGSDPSMIEIKEMGPFTIQIGYTKGAESSITLSIVDFYISAGTGEVFSNLGIGVVKDNITVGYEYSIPTVLIQMLSLPVIVESPVYILETVLVP